MRKRWCLRLAAGALVCALTVTGFGLDVPLKYHAITNSNRGMIPISLKGYYAGEFEVGGKRYEVALGDYNRNGRFDDFASAPVPRRNGLILPGGDHFYLTSEGKFDGLARQTLGNRLLVGDQFYDVALKITENKLVLSEHKEPLLPVDLAM